MANFEKTELEFGHKKQGGLWLLSIGIVLIAATIFGGKFLVHPIIFLAGYYAFFYIVNINRKVREKLSQGGISKFQIKIIYFSIAALFVLMFCIAGPFIPLWDWRMIWLGVMLATGLHFLLWYPVHGKSMVILGIICSLIAVCGYVTDLPYAVFGYADAAAKIVCGVYMLFFSKPSKGYIYKKAAK
ncbi:MAG: hypothetical protein IKR73_06080 [Oscillospiraceae bacterium]|nr:hypothetical protein [Oscillospiraceae bacterium]